MSDACIKRQSHLRAFILPAGLKISGGNKRSYNATTAVKVDIILKAEIHD